MRYGHFDTAADEYVIDSSGRPGLVDQLPGHQGLLRGPVAQRRRLQLLPARPSTAGSPGSVRTACPWIGPATTSTCATTPTATTGRCPGSRSASRWPSTGSTDGAEYRLRHGMGYTRFESAYRGIEASQTVFVPLDDAGRGLGRARSPTPATRAREPDRRDLRRVQLPHRSRSTTRTCRCRCTPPGRRTPTGSSSTTSTTSRGRRTSSPPRETPTRLRLAARQLHRAVPHRDATRSRSSGATGSNDSATTQNHCGVAVPQGDARPGGDQAARLRPGPRLPRRGRPQHAGQVRRPRRPSTPSSPRCGHTGGPSRTSCASAPRTRA